MNAILLGFGLTVVFLLIWAFHTNWKPLVKGCLCGVTAAAVVFGSVGFLWSRNGDTLSEKFRHTMIGMAQEETFRILSIDLNGNTVSVKNCEHHIQCGYRGKQSDTAGTDIHLQRHRSHPAIDADGMTCSFAEPELKHCQVQVQSDRLDFLMGYATPLEVVRQDGSWLAMGVGQTPLTEVPEVSSSKSLQQCYPYLNGRVFCLGKHHFCTTGLLDSGTRSCHHNFLSESV